MVFGLACQAVAEFNSIDQCFVVDLRNHNLIVVGVCVNVRLLCNVSVAVIFSYIQHGRTEGSRAHCVKAVMGSLG